MALNIKNPEVERLATELARLTGETKTETIRRALLERRARMRTRVDPKKDLQRIVRVLDEEIWSRIPPEQRGRGPSKAEREEILGYGPEGY